MPQPQPHESITSLWTRHRSLLGFLSAVALVCYASELFDFSLHMDSELHALDYEPADDWIAQGRWGLYLLNALLLPNTVMPVIPTLIAIAGMVTGALFLVLSLSRERSSADYLAAALAITCPVIYYALYYTVIGYGVGIGFALSSTGLYALTRWTKAGFAIAVLCFAFATGIYQAFLPLTGVLTGFWLAAHIANGNITSLAIAGQRIGISFIAITCASLLYALLTKLSLLCTGIEYAAGYLSAFIHFSLDANYLNTTTQQSLLVLLKLYGGSPEYYLYNLVMLRLLFVVSFAMVIWQLWCSRSEIALRIIGLLALLAALLAPAALLLMNAGHMPARTLFPAATAIAALVFISLQNPHRIARIAISMLAIACIYQFIVINNRFAFTNQMAWQADRELTVMIIERLDKLQQTLPADPERRRFPVEIVGMRAYPDIPVFEGPDMIGSSLYERSPAETTPRMTLLMRAMGNLDYRPARPDEKLAAVEQAKKMPSWPHEGAVAVVNGVMVVKLGDYQPGQIPVQ